MKRPIVLVAIAIIPSGYLLASCLSERRGIERTEAILRGDESVRLSSFEVEYQQRRVRCSDSDSLRYLERCFRENSPTCFDGRITYRVHLQFAGGGHVVARTDWSRGGFFICMPGDRPLSDGGEPRAWIVFRPPMPTLVQEMINFLNEDSGQPRGKVLHMEGGASRLVRDDSLLRD